MNKLEKDKFIIKIQQDMINQYRRLIRWYESKFEDELYVMEREKLEEDFENLKVIHNRNNFPNRVAK